MTKSILHGLTKKAEDYPFEDGRGRYASTGLTVGMTREQRPGQYYAIRNPRTGVEYTPDPQRVLRFFLDTMAQVIAEDLIIWHDEVGGQMERPRYKTYYDPGKLKPKPCSRWIETASTNDREIEEDENEYDLGISVSGMNQEGGEIVDEMFGAIEVLTEEGPRVETVDLVETFNFLYGLHVEGLETWVNEKDGRSYRAVKGKDRGGKRVLVLWRDMEGLDPVVERDFLEAKLKGEGHFDEMLINGDTATPGIKSLDGLFKRLLEEGER